MASINLGLGGSPTNRQPGASAAAAASPAAGARGTTERSQQNDVINVKLVYKRGFYWMIFKNEHHKNEALGILRKCDDPNLTVTLACLKNDETLNSRVKNDAPEDQEFVLPLTFSMPGHINNLINVLENDFKLDTESVPPRLFQGIPSGGSNTPLQRVGATKDQNLNDFLPGAVVPLPTSYQEVAKKFVSELEDIDSEIIADIVEKNIKGDFYTNIAQDIERLDFEDVDKEKLKDFVKALEYIFTDGIAGDVDTPKFNKTYETIRNYSKTKRHTFEKELDDLISTPTKNNLIKAVKQLEEKIKEPEWLIELTFLMKYREKINTLIKEPGFSDIKSIDIPTKLKDYLQFTIYQEVLEDFFKEFIVQFGSCDPKAIEAFAKDDPPENLPGGTFDTISKKIESLDLGEDEKRGLEDILKTVEHALSEVVDDFDVTYETIRAYTNAERLTFENTLNYLISTPTKENLIGAVNQLKEKFEDKEQLQWMIELTFLMEYREKINTLIKESGFRDIESISLPPILKEYLQYKSGVPARLPILEITEGNSDYTDGTDYSYSDDESDNGDKFIPKLETFEKTCTGFDPYLRPLDDHTIEIPKKPKKNALRGEVEHEHKETKHAHILKFKEKVEDFRIENGVIKFEIKDSDTRELITVILEKGTVKNDDDDDNRDAFRLYTVGCSENTSIIYWDGMKLDPKPLNVRKPVIYYYGYDANTTISTAVMLDRRLSFYELIPGFNHVVNINKASWMALSRLPGIGTQRAKRMVASRPKGGYLQVTDILEIKGIGAKTFDAINPFIGVDDTPNHWVVNQSSKNDGSVIDIKDNNAEHPYLFWEANAPHGVFRFNVDQSFCVKKDVLTSFLTEKLAVLGLNKKESVDFIEFWVPLLTGDSFKMYPYVMVEFMEENYTDLAALHIHPQPDQVIRVFAHFQLLAEPITCGEPELTPVTRMAHGRVVVEWGGTERFPDSMPNVGTSVKAPHYVMHTG